MELDDYIVAENITLAEFGQRVGGVEESTVARWRTGAMFPSPDNLRLIEKATGGRVSYADFQTTRLRRRGVVA